MSTKKAHKHVQEMTKRLAEGHADRHPFLQYQHEKEGQEFIDRFRRALDSFTPECMAVLLRMYTRDREGVDALCQYARRYKAAIPELDTEDLKELQDFVRVLGVHNS
jgi:hypothetical protein